jgi:hypothetical protein
MWEHRVPKEPALEEDHLAKTVAALERVAGRRPASARYWLETHPAGTHLRLEPSIWRDYPGSLS